MKEYRNTNIFMEHCQLTDPCDKNMNTREMNIHSELTDPCDKNMNTREMNIHSGKGDETEKNIQSSGLTELSDNQVMIKRIIQPLGLTYETKEIMPYKTCPTLIAVENSTIKVICRYEETLSAFCIESETRTLPRKTANILWILTTIHSYNSFHLTELTELNDKQVNMRSRTIQSSGFRMEEDKNYKQYFLDFILIFFTFLNDGLYKDKKKVKLNLNSASNDKPVMYNTMSEKREGTESKELGSEADGSDNATTDKNKSKDSTVDGNESEVANTGINKSEVANTGINKSEVANTGINKSESTSSQGNESEAATNDGSKSEGAVGGTESEGATVDGSNSGAAAVDGNESEAAIIGGNESKCAAIHRNKSESAAIDRNKSEDETGAGNESESAEADTNKSEGAAVDINESEAAIIDINESEAAAIVESESEGITVHENVSEAAKIDRNESEAATIGGIKSEGAVDRNESEIARIHRSESEHTTVELNESEGTNIDTNESEHLSSDITGSNVVETNKIIHENTDENKLQQEGFAETESGVPDDQRNQTGMTRNDELGTEPSDSVRYRREWDRYASYLRFSLTLAWPSRLAAAGFYFTGTGDRVVCFSCGQSYDHWRPGDNPMEIHRQISPSCRFVLGEEGNEPIRVSENAEQRLQEFLGRLTVSSVLPVLESSTIHSETLRNRCESESSVSDNELFGVSETSAVNTSDMATTNVSLPVNATVPSFTGQSSISGDAVASNDSHQSSSQLSLSNLPILQLSGFLSGSSSTSALTLQAARHPEYIDVQRRFLSFQHRWPHPENQSPMELAEAGFFFSGNSCDSTSCFYCGGGLRNWMQGDNPYVEHARWFPQCDFIRQVKADNFVDLVQEMNENEEEINYNQVMDILNDCRPTFERLGIKTRQVDKFVVSEGRSDEFIEKTRNTERATEASLLDDNEELICKVCLENKSRKVFLPCGHLCCCEDCALRLRRCPLCREIIQATVRAFLC